MNTLWLVLPAQFWPILIGIDPRPVRGVARGRPLDVAALTFSLFMWSLPTFFLGIILLVAGANWFGLPTVGTRSRSVPTSRPFWELALDVGSHLLLPTLTLTLVLLGEYMLIMRSSVLDVFGEDYILTARAKGLSNVPDHPPPRAAQRDAADGDADRAQPGLHRVAAPSRSRRCSPGRGSGRSTVNAVADRDYPVLQGAFLLIALSVVRRQPHRRARLRRARSTRERGMSR